MAFDFQDQSKQLEEFFDAAPGTRHRPAYRFAKQRDSAPNGLVFESAHKGMHRLNGPTQGFAAPNVSRQLRR